MVPHFIEKKGMGMGRRVLGYEWDHCVNGEDSGWPYGEAADGRKETPRDNYVLQLQPFNLYPFFTTKIRLSLCRKDCP